MIGYTLGAFTMMRLGSFSFSINTAAYQDLKRATEYKWAAQERFGQLDALQFTGPGEDSITLEGVILPAYRGGTGQVESLRALAATGQPQMLISGLGAMHGRWVIESVGEGQGVFAAAGIPRRQEFTLKLRKFDDGLLAAILGSAADAAGGAAAAGGVEGAKSGIAKLAENVSKAASDAAGKLNDAVAAVREKAAEIGQAVAPVIATATRAVSAVYAVQSAAVNLKRSVSGIRSLSDVPNVLGGLMTASSAASNAAALAAGAAKSAGISVAASAGETPAVQALRSTEATCGQVAVSTGQAYGQAQSIIRNSV